MKKKEPIDLWSIARIGGDAGVARRALEPMFEDEKDFLLNQLAMGSTDKGFYDSLSGRAKFVLQLEALFEMREEEGQQATDKLKTLEGKKKEG